MALTFGPLPDADEPAPTAAEIRAELRAHPGAWAVIYRADRMARAESHADKWRAAGFRAEVRKLGAECRVFASFPA